MSNNSAYKRASSIMQKAKGPKWKRELVSDHKFDFIDVEEFRDYTFLLTIRYFVLLCSVLISFATYGADIWSAGILLIYDHWSLSTQPKIPFYISKWIYVGCIALSFMLVAWEIRKTRNIMETRDISLAVTNPLAYRTYSVKSYSHFCLLQKIKNSTKWSDVIIFYVFYTLKGWKKVIIAQGPRQIIAGITVYALLKSAWTDSNGYFKFSSDWDTYGQDWPQRVALMLMSFTCILWILTALQIVLAVILYFPILCHIQGNLKEYCCHKIDKRIDEILEKQRKKRLREQEKKYSHSVSSKKSKKSTKKGNGKDAVELAPVPALPTLPVINDVDLYAGEKKNNPWLYQQPQHQNSFNNYYDNQPMTPLESNYSLQRSPTSKYSPYGETPYINQPQGAYNIQQKDNTSNYYYPNSNVNTPQYNGNNTIATPVMINGIQTNKPHAYDDPPQIINNGSRDKINNYSNSSQNNLNTNNNVSSSNFNTCNVAATTNNYQTSATNTLNNGGGAYAPQQQQTYINNSYNNTNGQQQQQPQQATAKRMNTVMASNNTNNTASTYSSSSNNTPITSPKKKDAVVALNSGVMQQEEQDAYSAYYHSSSNMNNAATTGDYYQLEDHQQQHYYRHNDYYPLPTATTNAAGGASYSPAYNNYSQKSKNQAEHQTYNNYI